MKLSEDPVIDIYGKSYIEIPKVMCSINNAKVMYVGNPKVMYIDNPTAMYIDNHNVMYHQQQNNWYPQRCLLANFEATFYFNRSELTCP